MKHKILGDTDCPIVEIELDTNESIKVERGAMVYMADVELEGKLNSNKGGIGGFFSAIGRSMLSGESVFITHARGISDSGIIAIAPSIPGKIVSLQVDDFNSYRLNTASFLACDDTVSYNMVSQDVSKAFFGGTGGFYVMETSGDGEILVSSFGDLIKLEVHPNQPLTIDNEHVVAWDSSLDYDIHVASGTFGFTTGEGLVNVFKGEGFVYVQTRNIRSLAAAIDPYIVKTSSNN